MSAEFCSPKQRLCTECLEGACRKDKCQFEGETVGTLDLTEDFRVAGGKPKKLQEKENVIKAKLKSQACPHDPFCSDWDFGAQRCQADECAIREAAEKCERSPERSVEEMRDELSICITNVKEALKPKFSAKVLSPETGQGRKFDDGKLRYSLLPWDSIEEVVKVLEYGAKKYDVDNWKTVKNGPVRYLDAAHRHMAAIMNNESLDTDSGLLHAAHAATNLLFATHFARKFYK